MAKDDANDPQDANAPWWRHPTFLFRIAEAGPRHFVKVFWGDRSRSERVSFPDPLAEQAVVRRDGGAPTSPSELDNGERIPWELRDDANE
jgi:hypothetical protein